ncbi:MAG: DUF938 domain-containing protein [Hyphomonadaceae bacterium]
MQPDARQFAPSTARNREPILGVLQRVLPRGARILEIASGAGEHAVYFAAASPGWTWTPSDPDAGARASIAAWIAAAALDNVEQPRDIDAQSSAWGVEDEAPYDAIVSINMVHISPWRSALGLMAGAWRLLGAGGKLILYGPFKREGRHTAPSNEAFEGWLKQRSPDYGVRDLADIEAAAAAEALVLAEIVDMPANNFMLVFERAGAKKPTGV